MKTTAYITLVNTRTTANNTCSTPPPPHPTPPSYACFFYVLCTMFLFHRIASLWSHLDFYMLQFIFNIHPPLNIFFSDVFISLLVRYLGGCYHLFVYIRKNDVATLRAIYHLPIADLTSSWPPAEFDRIWLCRST